MSSSSGISPARAAAIISQLQQPFLHKDSGVSRKVNCLISSLKDGSFLVREVPVEGVVAAGCLLFFTDGVAHIGEQVFARGDLTVACMAFAAYQHSRNAPGGALNEAEAQVEFDKFRGSIPTDLLTDIIQDFVHGKTDRN